MFEGTGWELEEQGEDEAKFDKMMPTVVKAGNINNCAILIHVCCVFKSNGRTEVGNQRKKDRSETFFFHVKDFYFDFWLR